MLVIRTWTSNFDFGETETDGTGGGGGDGDGGDDRLSEGVPGGIFIFSPRKYFLTKVNSRLPFTCVQSSKVDVSSFFDH
jgi:hypothetical protein